MRWLLALPLLALATPLAAQDHDAHDPQKGHKMPATAPNSGSQAPPREGREPAVDDAADDDCGTCVIISHPRRKLPITNPVVVDGVASPDQQPMSASTQDKIMDHGPDHGTMDHGAMDHGTMDHGAMGHGTPPAADDPPPARALEGPRHAADAIWGEQAMARSREQLAKENGGMTTGVLMVERLEARISDGEDAFLWDVQGWYGGDINRVFIKSEGEGEIGGSVEDAEVQLLYSRAIAPFFDLQAGARVDLEPETRSHLVLGVQGLAPYMFHVDGALFLSDRGDLTARVEGEYDQKITQRLILQPRMELELAAQDIPEREIGAGFTKLETGLRLRYEIAREFAPYIGVGYEAKLGETADIARANGEDPDGFAMLLGIRAWF